MPASTTGVTIRVISNRLPEIPAELRARVVEQVKTTTLDGEARAKQLAPVLTGSLRRSIHSVFSRNGLTGRFGPSVVYAFFVEFGTRHMGARSFMRPAAEHVLPRFVAGLRRLLGGTGR